MPRMRTNPNFRLNKGDSHGVPDVARRSFRLLSAQDAIQSFHSLEQSRCVRLYRRSAGSYEQGDGYCDDRRHLSQGPSYGGELAQKVALTRCNGLTKGGLKSKLHAVCDANGKPLILLLTEGQVSDYRGAATTLPNLPSADILIADRGYDRD